MKTPPISDFLNQMPEPVRNKGLMVFADNGVNQVREVSPHEWVASVGESAYRVEIRLTDSDGVESWDCSCPYDLSPACKHVAALLYHLQMEVENELSLPADALLAQTTSRQLRSMLPKDFHTTGSLSFHDALHFFGNAWEFILRAQFEIHNSGPDNAGQIILGILNVLIDVASEWGDENEFMDCLRESNAQLEQVISMKNTPLPVSSAAAKHLSEHKKAFAERYPDVYANLLTLENHPA